MLPYLLLAILLPGIKTLSVHIGKNGKPLTIKGPKVDDRIAIVGAGPAGVHMAMLLKKMGYLHVNILEARDRVGGKSRTISDRGAQHELGAVYLSEDYETNIRELAEEYQYGDYVDLPPPTVWYPTNSNPTDFVTYVIFETLAYIKSADPLQAAASLAIAIQRYINLHIDLFGAYDGELMPRPKQLVLNRINGTAKEFLERENIYVLRPLLVISQTALGYGQLDKVPALYVLLWNTPNLMTSLIRRLMGQQSIGIYLLSKGFQGLWEKIVQEEQLQVSFRSGVEEVIRTRSGFIVKHHDGPNWPDKITESKFDFVIWTPELGKSLGKIDATRREKKLFSGAKPQFFTTTLIDETGTARGLSPVDYWITNVLKEEENEVLGQRDSYSALNNISGPAYQQGTTKTGDDSDSKRTCVVYQLASQRPNSLALLGKLVSHYGALGGTITIKRQITWRYFPRYGVQDITRGILWDILDEQGRAKMWYIGSSVIFESTKSVVEYNKLLVSIMEPDNNSKHGWHKYGYHRSG